MRPYAQQSAKRIGEVRWIWSELPTPLPPSHLISFGSVSAWGNSKKATWWQATNQISPSEKWFLLRLPLISDDNLPVVWLLVIYPSLSRRELWHGKFDTFLPKLWRSHGAVSLCSSAVLDELDTSMLSSFYHPSLLSTSFYVLDKLSLKLSRHRWHQSVQLD